MYPEHLLNGLGFGHSLFILLTWRYFDLVKQVKFAISGHFLMNTWEEWPGIWQAHVSWPSEHGHGHGLLIFLILAAFWLIQIGQIWGFGAFAGGRME